MKNLVRNLLWAFLWALLAWAPVPVLALQSAPESASVVETEPLPHVPTPLEDFQKQIDEQPLAPFAYQGLLGYVQRYGKASEARKWLELRKQQDKTNPLPPLTLGHLLAFEHRWDEARQEWAEVLKINPGADGAIYAIIQSWQAQNQDWEALQALADFFDHNKNKVRWAPEVVNSASELFYPCAHNVILEKRPLAPSERRVFMSIIEGLFMLSLQRSLPGFEPFLQSLQLPAKNERVPARDLTKMLGDTVAMAQLCIFYGDIAILQLDEEAATYFYGQVLTLPDIKRYSLLYFDASGNLAHILEMTGQYEKAHVVYEQLIPWQEAAYRRAASTKSRQSLATNLLNFGNLLWEEGNVDQSLAYLYRAAQLFRSDTDISDPDAFPGAGPNSNLITFNNYQKVLTLLIRRNISLNNLASALRLLDRLRDLAQTEQLKQYPTIQAEVALEASQAYFQIGETRQAAQALEEVREWLSAGSNEANPAREDLIFLVQVNLLRMRLLLSQRDYGGVYRLGIEQSNLIKAYEARMKGHAIIRGPKIETALVFCTALLRERKLEALEPLLQDIDRLIPERDANGWRLYYLILYCQYYEARGMNGAALRAYRDFKKYHADYRFSLPITDDLYNTEQTVSETYAHFVDLLLRRGQSAEALEVLETSRAQTMLRAVRAAAAANPNSMRLRQFRHLQQLAWERTALTTQARSPQMVSAQNAETARGLNSRINAIDVEYASLYRSVTAKGRWPQPDQKLSTLLNHLKGVDADIAVLRFEPGDNTLTTWWIRHGQLRGTNYRRVDGKRLVARIQLYRTMLDNSDFIAPGTREPYEAVAQELGTTLLPELASLKPGRRLLIIPDRWLQQVPFAALYVQGKPLIQEKVNGLSYAVSLSILAYSNSRPLSKPLSKPLLKPVAKLAGKPAPGRALVVGFRDFGRTAASLDTAGPDAQEMQKKLSAQGWHATYLSQGPELTKSRVRQACAGQQFIFLQCHGKLVAGNPMAGYLRLSAKETVEASEWFDWPLENSRIVLSACEVGQDIAGGNADILGMTFPLFSAGAKQVVHAQWNAVVPTTRVLMQSLVEEMATGQPTDVALVSAQRRFLRQNRSYTRFPLYWAPWRVMTRD